MAELPDDIVETAWNAFCDQGWPKYSSWQDAMSEALAAADKARWRPRDELPTDEGEILVKALSEERPHHLVIWWTKHNDGWEWLERDYKLEVLGWMPLS